jgi:hypothetical protein
MFPIRPTPRSKHCAPLELQTRIRCEVYKHSAPPELTAKVGLRLKTAHASSVFSVSCQADLEIIRG